MVGGGGLARYTSLVGGLQQKMIEILVVTRGS
jgi:hypothetical protein